MLPRLAYISDVPVEKSYHGSLLVYRLLASYPPERLLVIESNLIPSRPELRLPGVIYHSLQMGSRRLQNTRFNRGYNTALFLRNALFPLPALNRVLAGFSADAVLSVVHGQLWMQAARATRERSLPLHLLHHDDWPAVANLLPGFTFLLERHLGRVYRQAASRGCVSPFMRDDYARRYGAGGEVCYPFRSAENKGDELPVKPCESIGGLRVAFAGTVNTPGYALLLAEMARSLSPSGGRLLIFGPLTQEAASSAGLDAANVELKGFVPSAELPGRLRQECDVLYVPMSFAEKDRKNMQMGFPSKLADYTAVGLPLLICGPAYCSAIQWAQEQDDVAETALSADDLAAALARLSCPERRHGLAVRAREAGLRCFTHRAAWHQLVQALCRQS